MLILVAAVGVELKITTNQLHRSAFLRTDITRSVKKVTTLYATRWFITMFTTGSIMKPANPLHTHTSYVLILMLTLYPLCLKLILSCMLTCSAHPSLKLLTMQFFQFPATSCLRFKHYPQHFNTCSSVKAKVKLHTHIKHHIMPYT